jgi:hypothetical protein
LGAFHSMWRLLPRWKLLTFIFSTVSIDRERFGLIESIGLNEWPFSWNGTCISSSHNFGENSNDASLELNITVIDLVARTLRWEWTKYIFMRLAFDRRVKRGSIQGTRKIKYWNCCFAQFCDEAFPEAKNNMKFNLISFINISESAVEIQSISSDLGGMSIRQMSCSMKSIDTHKFSW